MAHSTEVRRACSGPGLWPGPCRQARRAGRGLQRSRVGPEDRFCEAVRDDLRCSERWRRLLGHCAAFRPGGWDILTAPGALGATLTAWSWRWRARQQDTAGTAGGRSPGVAVRGSRRAWWASAQRARRKAAAPQRRNPRFNPGRPWRVTLAAHSLSAARGRPRCSRPGQSGLARRRCALEAVEKVVTAFQSSSC